MDENRTSHVKDRTAMFERKSGSDSSVMKRNFKIRKSKISEDKFPSRRDSSAAFSSSSKLARREARRDELDEMADLDNISTHCSDNAFENTLDDVDSAPPTCRQLNHISNPPLPTSRSDTIALQRNGLMSSRYRVDDSEDLQYNTVMTHRRIVRRPLISHGAQTDRLMNTCSRPEFATKSKPPTHRSMRGLDAWQDRNKPEIRDESREETEYKTENMTETDSKTKQTRRESVVAPLNMSIIHQRSALRAADNNRDSRESPPSPKPPPSPALSTMAAEIKRNSRASTSTDIHPEDPEPGSYVKPLSLPPPQQTHPPSKARVVRRSSVPSVQRMSTAKSEAPSEAPVQKNTTWNPPVDSKLSNEESTSLRETMKERISQVMDDIVNLGDQTSRTPSVPLLSAREQLEKMPPLSARKSARFSLNSARLNSARLNSARRKEEKEEQALEIVETKKPLSPRSQKAMDKLYGHALSSDESSTDEEKSQYSDNGVDRVDGNSIQITYALENAVQSDASDDGRSILTGTTSSSTIGSGAGTGIGIGSDNRNGSGFGSSIDRDRSSFTTLPGLRLSRENAIQRARRGSQTNRAFVSLYVDELPIDKGAFVALFFQRSHIDIQLSKKSKVFLAIEVYNARLNTTEMDKYDNHMSKIRYKDMVYIVECISMEQVTLTQLNGEDTVDIWFEMTSSSEGMYLRVASTYTKSSATLAGLEYRSMHDVDSVLAQRNFGTQTARQKKLPSIFLSPQLFTNDPPRVAGCGVSRKNRIIANVWNALRRAASEDWDTYVEHRESFVDSYSSIVDRSSHLESQTC
jgi:hypothetical protein